MATYKVLQDIEAEDKLFGPFTLKQFIFGAITIGFGFMAFLILSSPAPTAIKLPLVSILLPPILLFGFMAAPISRDQPNDIWLLARLRFLLKPHARIWNQDGISQLVTITAPKREIHNYTNGLTQTEVHSRLNALASTLDSRGWAVKNVTTNLFAQPGYLNAAADSDRLVDPSSLPQDVPATDITASDDILDETSNSTAQHLDQLVKASTQAQKQQAVDRMKSAPQQTPSNYWFMSQPAAPQMPLPQDFATFGGQQVVTPGTDDLHPAAEASDEEKALAERLVAEHKQEQAHITDHMKTLSPLHDKEGNLIKTEPTPQPAAPTPPVAMPNPAIIGLAHNDDLNISTISREARRLKGDDEVVVKLH